jgi:hypothetical protein
VIANLENMAQQSHFANVVQENLLRRCNVPHSHGALGIDVTPTLLVPADEVIE